MQHLWGNQPLLCRELVGREETLQALRDAQRLAANDKAQMIVLAGEAGIGKTKLCRAFTESCRGEQMLVLYGQAMHQDQALPFGPLHDALRRSFPGFPGATDTVTPAFQTALAFFVRLFPDLASFYPEVSLATLDEPDNHLHQLYQQQGLFHQILASLQALAQAQERKPLALILEDLHWADETSLDLLGFLAQRLEVNSAHSTVSMPILIVGTYRLEALAESPALSRLLVHLQTQRLLHEIHLPPLKVPEHWRCVNSILKQAVPEQFADYLYCWDEGNPFFTEELLGAMAASGQLHAQAHGWALPSDAKPELPTALKEAILDRFRLLPSSDQEILAYASVIGRVFDFSLLVALCQIDEHSLVSVLRRATQVQLISEATSTAPGGRERYHFRHALTREAIYDQMLTPERRLRHRAVAETLERLLSVPALASLPQNDAIRLLSEHYWHAGLPENARPYALQEAERARSIFAYREERYYLNIAQSSLPQDSIERLNLLQRMGLLSLGIFEPVEAIQWLDMAKAGYQRTGELHKALYVMANLLFAHWQIASPAVKRMVVEIEAMAERTFAELDTTGGDVEMLAGTALFTHYWMDHCLFSRAAPWLKRCFALFDALEDPGKNAAIQVSHLTHAWIAANSYTEDFEEGIDEARHVIDAASDYRLPEVFMIGHTNLAMLQSHWGRTADAESTLQEAVEHEERSGTPLPTFVYGLHYFFAGKAWEQAVVQMRLKIEQLERLHIDFLLAASRVSLTHILVAQGELQDAEQNLQAAEPATVANDEYVYLAPFLWEMAKLHTAQGKMQQAQQEYEHLMARWKSSEDALTIFPMLLDGIIFYAETSDLTNARRWLTELEATMHVTDNPVGTAALQEAQGIVLAAQGNLQASLTLLRQAVAAWEKLQWRYRYALTAQRLASVLLQWASQSSPTRSQAQATREEAAMLLDQADTIYQELHVPAGKAAVQALRNETHLEAQQKRRQTLMTRSSPRGLTPREMEVLMHMAKGESNKEIASALHLSVGTVELHVSHILARLDCETRTKAVAIALERGWIKR